MSTPLTEITWNTEYEKAAQAKVKERAYAYEQAKRILPNASEYELHQLAEWIWGGNPYEPNRIKRVADGLNKLYPLTTGETERNAYALYLINQHQLPI